MVKWQECWNGSMGMAEWLLNDGMVEWWEWLPTYYFMVHADDDTNDTDNTDDDHIF